jgi:hypothetical protein
MNYVFSHYYDYVITIRTQAPTLLCMYILIFIYFILIILSDSIICLHHTILFGDNFNACKEFYI